MKKSSGMAFRRFTGTLILLQAVLALTLFVFVWTLQRPHLVITSINLGVLALLELAFIIRYITRTNRDRPGFSKLTGSRTVP